MFFNTSFKTFSTESITICPCLLKLHGRARFKDGQHAESHIDIKIIVVDKNDNPPVFGVYEPAYIKERSPVGEWCCSPPAFSQICENTLLIFIAAKSVQLRFLRMKIILWPLCKETSKDVKESFQDKSHGNVCAVVFEIYDKVTCLTSKLRSLMFAGTSVMKVNATDADEVGNDNSLIAYSLVDQKPNHDMFYITKDGIIKVKRATLDREVVYNSTVSTKRLN